MMETSKTSTELLRAVAWKRQWRYSSDKAQLKQGLSKVTMVTVHVTDIAGTQQRSQD